MNTKSETLPMIPRALTIAGSDSGGGAGLQADLKTFTVHRVFGMSAVTALTAQNTLGVSGVHAVPAAFVRKQIDAVAGDIGIDAAKTGMLANAEIIAAVAAAVRDWRIAPLVVDPVLVAQSGASLLEAAAERHLLDDLLPAATIVTPNIPEAERLTGLTIRDLDTMHRAAQVLVERGARSCLVKGGHRPGAAAIDIFHDGRDTHELRSPWIENRNTHGTGCQLSAAITAHLARGAALHDAVARAKHFITAAIAAGLDLGRGAGPANPLAWLDAADPPS